MSAPLDLTKPVQTRDGRPARVICTDRKGESFAHPVVALVCDPARGKERLCCYTLDGRLDAFTASTEQDLVNAPTKRAGWVNIYRENSNLEAPMAGRYVHASKPEADRECGRDGRVACIRVEWEEPA